MCIGNINQCDEQCDCSRITHVTHNKAQNINCNKQNKHDQHACDENSGREVS